jgi:hypothetical protein
VMSMTFIPLADIIARSPRSNLRSRSPATA